MTVQTTQRRSGGGYLERPAPSGLADVIETAGRILEGRVRGRIVVKVK